jgi:hypothetical protein
VEPMGIIIEEQDKKEFFIPENERDNQKEVIVVLYIYLGFLT